MAEQDDEDQAGSDPAIRQRVVFERTTRGLSVRGAAVLGEISNTTWGAWEKGKIGLTATVREGVSKAYGWPLNWPEDLPPMPSAREDMLIAAMGQLSAQLTEVIQRLDRLEATVRPPD